MSILKFFMKVIIGLTQDLGILVCGILFGYWTRVFATFAKGILSAM